jgi:hypothetical protein
MMRPLRRLGPDQMQMNLNHLQLPPMGRKSPNPLTTNTSTNGNGNTAARGRSYSASSSMLGGGSSAGGGSSTGGNVGASSFVPLNKPRHRRGDSNTSFNSFASNVSVGSIVSNIAKSTLFGGVDKEGKVQLHYPFEAIRLVMTSGGKRPFQGAAGAKPKQQKQNYGTGGHAQYYLNTAHANSNSSNGNLLQGAAAFESPQSLNYSQDGMSTTHNNANANANANSNVGSLNYSRGRKALQAGILYMEINDDESILFDEYHRITSDNYGSQDDAQATWESLEGGGNGSGHLHYIHPLKGGGGNGGASGGAGGGCACTCNNCTSCTGKKAMLPPRTYALGVQDDIYRRVLSEISESRSMPCGLFFCGHHEDVSHPSICIAVVLVAALFFTMAVISVWDI